MYNLACMQIFASKNLFSLKIDKILSELYQKNQAPAHRASARI